MDSDVGIDFLLLCVCAHVHANETTLACRCKKGAVSLGKVKMLVLDEADRMLDFGFQPQLEEIAQRLSQHRRLPGVDFFSSASSTSSTSNQLQTLFYSATWSVFQRFMPVCGLAVVPCAVCCQQPLCTVLHAVCYIEL